METTFTHVSFADLEEQIKSYLEDRGYLVVEAPNLETPAEVAARYNLPASTLSKRLHHFPGYYPGRVGRTGRVLQLHVTPELDVWLKKAPRRP